MRFPSDFVWACATAAYQIEGAANEDGRKPSVWDTFSHTPGKTFQGDTGDVADDSYHLYKEDVKLLKNLGVTAYRFSISWPRVFPDGTGQPNEKGIAYYERVVDELLRNNIAPYATLFHWDLPQALPGGWQSRDTSKAFADYAAYISRRLSDRVRHFFTVNEFVCFTDLSYSSGQFAPGLKLPPAQVNQIRHHAVLAHGMGVQAIRANARAGTGVGLAENATVYVPVIESPVQVEAARRATREGNAPFLTAVMEGKYTDRYLEHAGPNAPKVEAGDMKIIGAPLDFVGLNVYTPEYVSADASPAGYSVLPRPTSSPRMASPWLFIGPEVLYWAVRNVSDIWKPPSLYITENGCSAADVVTPPDASKIQTASCICVTTSRICIERPRKATPSRDTSSGVCSTTTNGRTATANDSGYTTSISGRRPEPPSSARSGTGKSSPATRWCDARRRLPGNRNRPGHRPAIGVPWEPHDRAHHA